MANRHVGSLRRGPWLDEEDERLTTTVGALGEKHWDALARQSGLRRSGKSCRLRWMNYLRPNLKHGEITYEEEHIILHLHKQWGNKWSRIAKSLPGRTDNEIKNYWRSHLKKKTEAQQECFEGGGKDAVRSSDGMKEEDAIFDMTGLGSSSPYESRISDWISWCCDSDIGQKGEEKDDEDLYQIGWSYEHTMWDLWSPV